MNKILIKTGSTLFIDEKHSKDVDVIAITFGESKNEVVNEFPDYDIVNFINTAEDIPVFQLYFFLITLTLYKEFGWSYETNDIVENLYYDNIINFNEIFVEAVSSLNKFWDHKYTFWFKLSFDYLEGVLKETSIYETFIVYREEEEVPTDFQNKIINYVWDNEESMSKTTVNIPREVMLSKVK